MQILWGAVLAALTNWLLLTAVTRFLNITVIRWRIALGASIGAVLTAVAMLPGYHITQTLWWRLVTVVAAALCAFGKTQWKGRALLLFALLHLSLGGAASCSDGYQSMVVGSVGICLACIARSGREQLVQVTIPCSGHSMKLTALRDTGNTLTDPITGNDVLVVDAQTAQKLTGLSSQQLRDPVETMQHVPGLRLIPYRTIDSSGFLLAKQIDGICMGSRKGSVLVAFSPQSLGSKYQALTGGRLW